MTYTISKKDKILSGDIHLDGSKSISNRVLLIRALCKRPFQINHLSTSDDTRRMQTLLGSNDDLLDAGAAGTTFRFLTAYFAFRAGRQILTGSDRMKQRPIGILVEALKKIGADIEYLEKQGFPPLKINPPKNLGQTSELRIAANISSQYISALLLLAPTLPNGLQLCLEGEIVSRPYIEMTLRLMEFFGVKHQWKADCISIKPQQYMPKDFTVEADWSAASYWYAMAAFASQCKLTLNGLFEQSLQGDSVLPQIMQTFGVESRFDISRVHLQKSGNQPPPFFEHSFLHCPDLAQTLAVVCAGLGVHGVFTGLETLRIKETDRINALQVELAKINVHFSLLPGRFSKKSDKDFYMLEGKAVVKGTPSFSTYKDHRMAMAFAPLALLGKIKIENPQVVKKSYPGFWDDMEKVGFTIEKNKK
ncbi:MAG TPA: 3-phosphoshikimate 1-carboxyvinyltransferase [Bacteroidetes bacterium]|nr:3-phosphoshikimate 1-carboxyvinyltransferase [Bacteroidota bacterium]